MNMDLEAQLGELGPDYRALVGRLRSARDVAPRAAPPAALKAREPFPRPFRVGLLAAAALFAAICLAFVCERRPVPRATPASVYTIAYAPTEEDLCALVAAQRADGSWENDFLTRQNAAALRRGKTEELHVAYRRAVRYLRSKGLAPLTDEELLRRGESAVAALNG